MFSLDKGKKICNNKKLSIKTIASGTGGMADALDSGSSAARLPGSSPGFRILLKLGVRSEELRVERKLN